MTCGGLCDTCEGCIDCEYGAIGGTVSETKPSPEAQASEEAIRAECEELAHGWLVMSETAPFEAQVESLTRLMLGIIRERERLALERAATIAREAAPYMPTDEEELVRMDSTDYGYRSAARDIAAAISALIPGQGPTAGQGKEGADGE